MESIDSAPEKVKVLYFDLETSPNLGYSWGKWEQNIIEFEKEWIVLSFCAKWMGGKTIVRALPDYPVYRKNRKTDKALIKELHALLNQADILIAHNGDAFDIKKANTRFIEHGLVPPRPRKTIDTLKIARRHFGFNSNKLDDLGRRLGVGRKIKHSGFDLWKGCMSGDMKSWRVMKKYNKQDVILLERVYLKLRSWLPNHPSLTLLPSTTCCSTCSSKNIVKKGWGFTKFSRFPRFLCKSCGAWSRGNTERMSK